MTKWIMTRSKAIDEFNRVNFATPIFGLIFGLIALTSAVGFVGGCAVKLAPDYDRTIVEGLGKANEEIMTLFASVSAGTEKATFKTEREATYNQIIGKLDALRLQVDARPTPRPYILQIFGIGKSTDKEPDDIEVLNAPTSDVLKTMAGTLVKMRDTDREKGISSGLVEGFKRSVEISMDQALTYEKALER